MRGRNRTAWYPSRFYVTDILSSISAITEVNFAKFELDAPLPERHRHQR